MRRRRRAAGPAGEAQQPDSAADGSATSTASGATAMIRPCPGTRISSRSRPCAVHHVIAAAGIDRRAALLQPDLAAGAGEPGLERRLHRRERQLLARCRGARAETAAGTARGRSGSPRAPGRAAAGPGSTCPPGSRQSTRFSYTRATQSDPSGSAPHWSTPLNTRRSNRRPASPITSAMSSGASRAMRVGPRRAPGAARTTAAESRLPWPSAPGRGAQLEVEASGAVAGPRQRAAERVRRRAPPRRSGRRASSGRCAAGPSRPRRACRPRGTASTGLRSSLPRAAERRRRCAAARRRWRPARRARPARAQRSPPSQAPAVDLGERRRDGVGRSGPGSRPAPAAGFSPHADDAAAPRRGRQWGGPAWRGM